MKISRMVISSLLSVCMLVSLTGCFGAAEYTIDPKGLAEYADKKGADEYKSPNEWYNDLRNNWRIKYSDDVYQYEYSISDVYIYIEEDPYDGLDDDIETAMATPWQLILSLYSGDLLHETTCYMIGDGDDAYGAVISVKGNVHSDNAYSYMERITDNSAEWAQESESGLKDNIQYYLYYYEDGDLIKVVGIYDDQLGTVFIIHVTGEEDEVVDMVDEICKDFGLISPCTLK